MLTFGDLCNHIFAFSKFLPSCLCSHTHTRDVMAERGWNPFVKAFVYFVRSFKPSYWRRREVLVGKDHLGNQYFEIKAGNSCFLKTVVFSLFLSNGNISFFLVKDPSRGIRKPTRSFVPPHPDDWDVPLPPEWNG